MTNSNDLIDVFNGGNEYFSHWMKPFIFTNGVKALAEALQCYWLLDVIISYQGDTKVNSQPFQVWNLSRVRGNEFMVSPEDGNNKQLLKQSIPFSDFPNDTVRIWLIDNCLLLPAEY